MSSFSELPPSVHEGCMDGMHGPELGWSPRDCFAIISFLLLPGSSNLSNPERNEKLIHWSDQSAIRTDVHTSVSP